MSYTGRLKTDVTSNKRLNHTQNFTIDDILFNQQGIDTVTQIANYKTVINIIQREGLELENNCKNLPINPYLKSIEKQLQRDQKIRYKKEQFKPIIEYVKISEGKTLSNYMIIVRNIPLLFDYATEKRKAKDFYCHIIFAGLHQPTKEISSKSMKFISKMLKRKSFKWHSSDIATDFLLDEENNYQKKEEFKKQLKPYINKNSHINKGTSLYINDVNDKHITKILLYDKFIKQTSHQKQTLDKSLSNWKRLEIEIQPSKRCNFMDFINSNDFIEVLDTIKDISNRVKVSEFDNNYIEYQLNSLIDNRVMNNKPSKKRFNSKESLERFKQSDFRRYILI